MCPLFPVYFRFSSLISLLQFRVFNGNEVWSFWSKVCYMFWWKFLWIVFLSSQLGVAKTIVRDDREFEANSIIQRTPTEVSSTVPPASILEVVCDGKRSCNHANISQNIPNNEEIGSLVDTTVNKREHEEHQGFQDLQGQEVQVEV